MKVSFDLDDTAWKYRTFFRELAHALKAAGHTVGMLTGHGDASRESDFALWEARGFPPADFLLNADDCMRAGVMWHDTPQRTWKLQLARKMGIDAHFDDFGNLNSFRLECWIGMPDESQT
jgi:hypothetical protein